MAQGSALLVSILVLTSVVRPETRDNDVDRQSTDHETVKCFSSVVDPATEGSPLKVVKRSTQTSSDEGNPDPPSRIPLTSKEKNDSNIASKVTNSEEHRSNKIRTEYKNAKNGNERGDDVSAGRRTGQNVAQNLEETGRNQKQRTGDEEESRKAADDEMTTDQRKKKLLSNIDLDSLIAQTIGSDVTSGGVDDVARTRRDLRNLKRIMDDDDDDDAETSTGSEEAGEDYLDNGEQEVESVDQSNYEVPQIPCL